MAGIFLKIQINLVYPSNADNACFPSILKLTNMPTFYKGYGGSKGMYCLINIPAAISKKLKESNH